MAEPIADDPASWTWPEDVRERLAAKRAGIEAVRQADAEDTERVGTIWSDWLRKMRETAQADEQPNLHDYLGWPNV